MAKIKDNTQGVLKEVDRLISRNLRLAALLVERSAKQMVPVDTGTLKRSILSNWYGAKGTRSTSWKATKKGRHFGKMEIEVPVKKEAIVGTNIEYAPYVELGTSNPEYPAQPYLQPALHSNMKEIRRIFRAR